jgi:hypothetical protein
MPWGGYFSASIWLVVYSVFYVLSFKRNFKEDTISIIKWVQEAHERKGVRLWQNVLHSGLRRYKYKPCSFFFVGGNTTLQLASFRISRRMSHTVVLHNTLVLDLLSDSTNADHACRFGATFVGLIVASTWAFWDAFGICLTSLRA